MLSIKTPLSLLPEMMLPSPVSLLPSSCPAPFAPAPPYDDAGREEHVHTVIGVAHVLFGVRVGAYVVVGDDVARHRGDLAIDEHAVIVVAGDDVLRRVRRTSDQVVRRLDAHAVSTVAPV